jgi:hypothetical protein
MKKKINKDILYIIIPIIIVLFFVVYTILDNINKNDVSELKNNLIFSLQKSNYDLKNENQILIHQLDSIKHLPTPKPKTIIKWKVKKDTIKIRELIPLPASLEVIEKKVIYDTVKVIYPITDSTLVNIIKSGQNPKYNTFYPLLDLQETNKTNTNEGNDWLDKIMYILGTALGVWGTIELTK